MTSARRRTTPTRPPSSSPAKAQAVIDGHSTKVSANHLLVIPKGAEHNIINKGDEPLKLFTVYSPPAEEPGISHKTKEDAEAEEEEDDED